MIRRYYNEIEPYAAQWIRNLMAANIIPPGDVDERSIADVSADDLRGYTQCHFFAGLGGWAYAGRLAGWPDDEPWWTGSCPCQPFSVAGKQKGFDDSRHLWPHWQRLIQQRYPVCVFGEQVAAAGQWLALVRSDMETMGYAVGAIPMEAASTGAEHYRDRYWFVADRAEQSQREPYDDECAVSRQNTRADASGVSGRHPTPIALADDDDDTGLERWNIVEYGPGQRVAWPGSATDCLYIECPGGKWRRLPPPGIRWLGHEIPARVSKLRAYGNAIDPQAAAVFIRAYMECSL